MKKKYMIAIAAVAVFAAVATAFAIQAGGKDDPLTPVESTTSSSVSLTIGEINSAGVAGGAAGSAAGVSGAASAGDKNTTELTSIAPKSSSTPPAPVIDGAGSETSSGYTKATNPALTDPSKKPSYKELMTVKRSLRAVLPAAKAIPVVPANQAPVPVSLLRANQLMVLKKMG